MLFGLRLSRWQGAGADGPSALRHVEAGVLHCTHAESAENAEPDCRPVCRYLVSRGVRGVRGASLSASFPDSALNPTAPRSGWFGLCVPAASVFFLLRPLPSPGEPHAESAEPDCRSADGPSAWGKLSQSLTENEREVLRAGLQSARQQSHSLRCWPMPSHTEGGNMLLPNTLCEAL